MRLRGANKVQRIAGYSYDFAGNLKTDAAGHGYDYDAENMQVKYDATVAQYAYDGSGQLVKSVTNVGTTVFVYDAMGKLLAEYQNLCALAYS